MRFKDHPRTVLGLLVVIFFVMLALSLSTASYFGSPSSSCSASINGVTVCGPYLSTAGSHTVYYTIVYQAGQSANITSSLHYGQIGSCPYHNQ